MTRSLLIASVAFLAAARMASAGIITIAGGSTSPPNTWNIEPGGSIPPGTQGFVNGTLLASAPDEYTFTYGGGGLLPGDTGHGDSTYPNSFWIGPDQATASAAGHVFCATAQAACGGAATAVGAQFTVFLPAGAVPFGFTFGLTGTDILRNSDNNPNIGAYMVQVGLGTTPFAGPGYTAYIGLTDRAYPTPDDDFQDLVVTVTTIPEPTTMLLMAAGLIGAGLLRRRR